MSYFLYLRLLPKGRLRLVSWKLFKPEHLEKWLQYLTFVSSLLPKDCGFVVKKVFIIGQTSNRQEHFKNCDSLESQSKAYYLERKSVLPQGELTNERIFKQMLPVIFYESLFGGMKNVWFRRSLKESFSQEIYLGDHNYFFLVFKYNHNSKKAFCKFRGSVPFGHIWTIAPLIIEEALIAKSMLGQIPSLFYLSVDRILDNEALFIDSKIKLPNCLFEAVRNVWWLSNRFELQSISI